MALASLRAVPPPGMGAVVQGNEDAFYFLPLQGRGERPQDTGMRQLGAFWIATTGFPGCLPVTKRVIMVAGQGGWTAVGA